MQVLAYTSPAKGHLYPTVPILLELQRRGHDVALRTLAEDVPRMTALGFAAAPIDPRIEAIRQDDHLARTSVGAITRTIRVGAARARLEIPDLHEAIAASRPDVLLIDTNTWGAAVAAEASGLPWAVLQHFLTPLPSPDTPPFGPGIRPATGPLGRARDRVLRPLVLGGFERALLPPVNALRSEAGLPPVQDATAFYTRAPLTLYLTARAFEHPRVAWPDSYCFVGPVLWEPTADAPAWLATIDRPVVLVTTSSEFQDDRAIVAAAVRGLAAEDVAVVATVPAGGRLADPPGNARIERWVPHSPVLERAVVAVTHGGMGATQKALVAGVPVVVVPWGRDQLEVGRRVEAAGVGVLLPKRRLSPTAMRVAVARARAMAPAAAAFAAGLATAGGPPLAADRVEELVG